MKLGIDRLAVASDNGNTCHCGGDGDGVVAQYLASLVDQLLFLGGVSVLAKIAAVGEQVAEYLVGICLAMGAHVGEQGGGVASFGSMEGFFLLQLTHRLDTCSGNALIGADDQSFELVLLVQARQCQHHLDGAAVGVGNDVVIAFHHVDVYLGNHQRLVGILAPRRRVVDHHGAFGGKQGCILFRHRCTCRKNGILGCCRNGIFDRYHCQFATIERNGLAYRFGRGGGDNLTSAKTALAQHLQHDAAYQSRCADHSNFQTFVFMCIFTHNQFITQFIISV